MFKINFCSPTTSKATSLSPRSLLPLNCSLLFSFYRQRKRKRFFHAHQKTYTEAVIELHTFLTSALDEGEWSDLKQDQFNLAGGGPSVTIEEGAEWFPRIRLGALEKTEILSSAGNRTTIFRFSPARDQVTVQTALPANVHIIQCCHIQLTCRSVFTLGHSTCHMRRKVHYIPILPLTGFLRYWSQKGLGSSPVLSRESPRTVQYLLDVLAVGYMGRLTSGEPPESRVRILTESLVGRGSECRQVPKLIHCMCRI